MCPIRSGNQSAYLRGAQAALRKATGEAWRLMSMTKAYRKASYAFLLGSGCRPVLQAQKIVLLH